MLKNVRIVVGLAGSSSPIYGIRTLEALREAGVETHLVISDGARRTIPIEARRRDRRRHSAADAGLLSRAQNGRRHHQSDGRQNPRPVPDPAQSVSPLGRKEEMKARRVSETIARRIQRAITTGKLEPGEKLPAERDLAKKLNVSRVSVREAYRSLAELGLLSVKRGAEGGAFIADFDHEPVTRSLSLMLRLGRTSHEELTEARVLLEPPIARLAALRASAEDIRRLEELVEKQEAGIKGNGNPRRYDLQFHRLVPHSTKNLHPIILIHPLPAPPL